MKMRKMKLDMDALKVESFDTGGGNGLGTVRAHNEEATLVIGGCPTPLCIEPNKCASLGPEASCGDTMYTCAIQNTCNESCNVQTVCGASACCPMTAPVWTGCVYRCMV
jgi:hypothetical protein